jgi:hypothetical protein
MHEIAVEKSGHFRNRWLLHAMLCPLDLPVFGLAPPWPLKDGVVRRGEGAAPKDLLLNQMPVIVHYFQTPEFSEEIIA